MFPFFKNHRLFGGCFESRRIALAEKNRADRYLNDGIKLAQELSDMRVSLRLAEERLAEAQAEVDRVKADNDNLARDLLLAARSESMAVERAWHAGELVKILKARISLHETPRGVISESE